MKKLLLFISLFTGINLFAQNNVNKDFGDKINFVIGLPKATHSELELIKADLQPYSQITYSEFFFNERILLIECEPNPEKLLDYQTVETILFKYFGHDHVLRKQIISFQELKSKRDKTDKFTIK